MPIFGLHKNSIIVKSERFTSFASLFLVSSLRCYALS